MRKKILYKFLPCFLVVCTLLSVVTISVSALSWDGSSSGGSGAGSPAGPNGYAIRTTGDNCLGFRFSVTDKSGNTKNGLSVDIFRNTSYGNMEYSSAYKFNNKYNKKQIINTQNNGFSSSKTTSNCYKETEMGFAWGLPEPDGIGSWQNNVYNLNPVLSRLGIGSINNLKYGDKVLVEPLFDVRLQSIYHSVTVTELALYGKWLLGANSDGGTSSTSASWGFISAYTNKIYPNALYTPDGQGLWSGVGALGSRGTFYNLINKGYGVGIAYTENKPDFTPSLNVNICEAWPGNAGNRVSHFGISNGSSFGNYTYGNGYPSKGDKVWFAINFPSESENCYVRQTVWVVGGGSTSRNVYSNNGTWYDVSLSPNVVDSGRSSYSVKARVDWIDSGGNVLKWGTEKTFYIPVKPKINRYQVTLTDIMGKVSASSGLSGNSGKVYVGQRVYPQYTFTSENNWTSSNHFFADMYEWKSGAWKSKSDLSAHSIGINQNSSYKRNGASFVVPDNSSNNNGSNRIPFLLSSQWASDSSRTNQDTWYDIPVVKADVELLEIKLIDENGYYVEGRRIWAGQTVTPQYIYKNNTNCTIYIEGYNTDKTRIGGTYAIPAYGQITVNGKKVKVTNGETFSIWGGVYLDGAGRGNTEWETNGNNNHWWRYWFVDYPLSVEIISPNSLYRESVQVITSFKAKNVSPIKFTPDKNIKVRFSIYNKSELLYTSTKPVVIPANGDNLVYFKWTVPKNLNGVYVTVRGEIVDNGSAINGRQIGVKTEKIIDSQTPNTKFEKEKPTGFNIISPPARTNITASEWSEWVYENNRFVKKTYSLLINTTGKPVIAPDVNSPSRDYKNGYWHMKSGYGFTANWNIKLYSYTDTLYPTSTSITAAQTAYMYLPEFSFSSTVNKYRVLSNTSTNTFMLPINYYADNNARLHFIPLWYPDGSYTIQSYAGDLWTPAGMLSAYMNSNPISVSKSAYDDWYIG